MQPTSGMVQLATNVAGADEKPGADTVKGSAASDPPPVEEKKPTGPQPYVSPAARTLAEEIAKEN